MLGKKVGIDLGSARVRVLPRGESDVLDEPAVVACAREDGRPLAVGVASHDAVARGAELRRPLEEGRIVDRLALDALVTHVIGRAVGRQRIFRPDVMVAVASWMRGDDRRAVMDVAVRAGARTVYLVDAPLAAAIGCGLPVTGPSGHLVVHAGAGVVDVAVVAHEGIVSGRCVAAGGARLTEAVADHLRATRGLEVDEASAEEAKRELGSASPLREERTLRIDPRDGGTVTVRSGEVFEAIAPLVAAITAAVRETVEECPALVRDDLRGRSGALLTGGGARLTGLDRHLSTATGLRIRAVDDGHLVAVRGATAALEGLDIVRRNLLYVR